MIKSEQINELAKALSAFQAEMKSVVFDKENPFFKSKYATLANIVESSKPVLAKNGLSVTQLATGDGGITTVLLHTSGQYIGDTLTLKPSKDDPQGRGSAITYSRRYSYAAILGVVSDEDDDGNIASIAKPVIQQPQSKSTQTKSIKDMVLEKAKTKFKSSDDFKLWRVENGLVEDLEKASELQLSNLLLRLK